MAIDRQRHDAILKTIHGSDLQAIAAFSPPDVLLLTGYWPVMGASLAILTRDGMTHVLLPTDELELAQATSHAECIAYEPETLARLTNAAEALAQPMRQLAARLHFTSGAIGTTLRDGTRPASYQASNHFRSAIEPLLRQAYPDVSVVSADAALDRLKSVHTDAELDRLRRACGLAAVGFHAAPQAIAAGRREDEVAADIESAFSRVANDGFERGLGYFFCMSGPNSAKASGAYARTRSRVLQQGDLVMIHANTAGDGLWTDITRTYVVGQPSDRQQRMRSAIAEARQAALKAISPGTPASRVDGAARDVLARHGFGPQFKHATGHGVGFAAADPNALPRIHPKSPDVLEAGMTFNIEPAIYFDSPSGSDGAEGMRHCDVVACTHSGAEVLTDF